MPEKEQKKKVSATVLEQKVNPTGNPMGNGQTLRFTPVHAKKGELT